MSDKSGMEQTLKPQTEYTLEEAKKVIIGRLLLLANYAEEVSRSNLYDMHTRKDFEVHGARLRILEHLVKGADEPYLTEMQINQVLEFAQFLITVNVKIGNQLVLFWGLLLDVNNKMKTDKAIRGYDISKFINQNNERINRIDNISADISKDYNKFGKTLFSAAALLLVHVLRVESIEY
ncbi:MAG: hypothetical protein HZB68_03975, partial [Candidatus Aenigmarchaeota archaeon]|nr:hypothetical protein [Candidatus Aenigmarchaeota archaeon]